jgi:hypothetical protein
MNFGNMSFDGGIQNFGGQNTNTQQNLYLSPREQVATQLAALRAAYPDPAVADREIPVIEEGLRAPSPENRHRVDAALKRLAANAGSARTAAEAIAAIGALVAAHWPF